MKDLAPLLFQIYIGLVIFKWGGSLALTDNSAAILTCKLWGEGFVALEIH